jgi:hypothetical protein
MHPVMRMIFAVLARRVQADAIRESCLQAIEIGSADIHAIIDHKTGQMLPHALAHDSSLPMMDAESFLPQDGCGMDGKALGAPFEFFTAGECEIVGVPCVSCSRGSRQA